MIIETTENKKVISLHNERVAKKKNQTDSIVATTHDDDASVNKNKLRHGRRRRIYVRVFGTSSV